MHFKYNAVRFFGKYMLPEQIFAGATLEFSEYLSEYPAGTSCFVSYILINSANRMVITSTPDGTNHKYFVPAATTANFESGTYSYQKVVYSDTDVIVLEQGACVVTPLFAGVNTLDNRTFAQRMVEAIEAVLENRATMTQSSITYKNRTLQNTPYTELIQALSIFKMQVQQEQNLQKLKNGEQIPKIIFGF